jgi:hypothetical protein
MDPHPFVNPPIYSAIAVTNFLAIIFGIIFKDMLEYQVASWQLNRESQPRIEYDRPSLVLTYLTMCLFLTGFVMACLMVIGIEFQWAAGIGVLLVGSTATLIWVQLGSLLKLLVLGGSNAIAIDTEPEAVGYPEKSAEA